MKELDVLCCRRDPAQAKRLRKIRRRQRRPGYRRMAVKAAKRAATMAKEFFVGTLVYTLPLLALLVGDLLERIGW